MKNWLNLFKKPKTQVNEYDAVEIRICCFYRFCWGHPKRMTPELMAKMTEARNKRIHGWI